MITGNQAIRVVGVPGGSGGGATGGQGGTPGGSNGQAHPGTPGATGTAGLGVGGGLDLAPGGTATIDNTTISGNSASNTGNDVFGTFSV
jgi:hypothetical protein